MIGTYSLLSSALPCQTICSLNTISRTFSRRLYKHFIGVHAPSWASSSFCIRWNDGQMHPYCTTIIKIKCAFWPPRIQIRTRRSKQVLGHIHIAFSDKLYKYRFSSRVWAINSLSINLCLPKYVLLIAKLLYRVQDEGPCVPL